jgi:hypothetical protein
VLGDGDLLISGGHIRSRGVLTATVRSPGAGGELKTTLVTVAGVDGPVAAGFTTGDLVPFRIGSRLGLAGEGDAAASDDCTRDRDLGDAD